VPKEEKTGKETRRDKVPEKPQEIKEIEKALEKTLRPLLSRLLAGNRDGLVHHPLLHPSLPGLVHPLRYTAFSFTLSRVLPPSVVID
jgi:hypothetical protein